MAGRPRKTWAQTDVEQFTKLCGIMCTKKEVCAVMQVDPKTLDKLIDDNFPNTPTWEEAFNYYSATGKASLRRAQFQLALEGDKTMLIFLGKNYLGQSDQGAKVEAEKPKTKMSAYSSSAKFAKAVNG